MRARRSVNHRQKRANALEVLQTALETPDEAAWYAQRLELLGRAIFGDLWESDKAEAAGKNRELP